MLLRWPLLPLWLLLRGADRLLLAAGASAAAFAAASASDSADVAAVVAVAAVGAVVAAVSSASARVLCSDAAAVAAVAVVVDVAAVAAGVSSASNSCSRAPFSFLACCLLRVRLLLLLMLRQLLLAATSGASRRGAPWQCRPACRLLRVPLAGFTHIVAAAAGFLPADVFLLPGRELSHMLAADGFVLPADGTSFSDSASSSYNSLSRSEERSCRERVLVAV